MDTKERVIKILGEQLGINKTEIKEEQNLITDLGMDSLDTVEVIMSLEKEFGIKIPDGEVSNLATVKDIIKKIEEIRLAR